MRNFDSIVRGIVAALLVVSSVAYAQQGFPNRPIRIIIPYPPGGSNDVIGRLVGQRLGESLGVQAVIDNRGGGQGVIGSEALVKSVPDGHTIMITSVNAHLVTSLLMVTPYDPVKDFAPVATIDASEYLMVVHPSLPANTLQEFIALAKAKPGFINYASSTSSSYMTTAMFELRAGIKMQHVPYKGAGPALNDLLGGHVQMFFSTPSSMVGHVRAGKLKPIATTNATRLTALPQVPTFAESGVRDFEATALRGVLAAPATPKPVIERLSKEIGKIVTSPDFRERLDAHGMSPLFLTPTELGERMRKEFANLAKAVKAMKLAPRS